MSQEQTINLQYTTIKDLLPDFIHKDLERFSREANLYHPQPVELIEKLSQKHNLPKEMFYLTAEIDEALQMFILTYGQNTTVFTPTYVVYSDVEIFGGELDRVYSIEGAKYKINPKRNMKRRAFHKTVVNVRRVKEVEEFESKNNQKLN